MQNEHPHHEPFESTRPESKQPTGPSFDSALEPESGLCFFPAGTWKERSDPETIVLLILSATPGLLTSRDSAGAPTRTPTATETVWFIPARTPFAAHWHGPVSIVCLRPVTEAFESPLPRVFRLVDLARLDWELSRLCLSFQQALCAQPSIANLVSRRVLAVLAENETHWRTAGLSNERLQATCDLIEEHLAQNISRELLAEADGQSLHHFVRMFKLRTGLTLRQYIARRRCFRARELIESGERLAEAAAAVGFFDQPEMCRKFNDVFGCPPSKFAPDPLS